MIYIENPCPPSGVIAEVLGARLREPRGPEAVVATTSPSPSYLGRLTLNPARMAFIRGPRSAELFGR